MGIYDREYYRGETRGSGWFSGAAPVCKAIIIINVAVFIFERLINKPDSSVIDTYFAVSVDETLHHFRLWQLLTGTFFHANIWHLLFNMWFFWIVAREMEPMYGSRDFAAFYIAAAIFSSLVWVLIAYAADSPHPMIGASGAVTAVVTLFTLFYPKREIHLYFIPMPMWAMLAIVLVAPLLFKLNGASSRVAIEAHLAGAGFAFAYKQFDLRWSRLTGGRFFRPRLRIFTPVPREPTASRTPSPWRTSASVGTAGKAPAVSILPEEQLDAQLDEVLAKIAREGRGGLTEDEQRVLQEASRRARIRRSDRP